MGVNALRERIAERLRRENGIPATAGNVLIAAGAKQAFQLALMAMLEPGDEVIVLEPAFVSFVPQIYIAEPQCVVHTIDVNRDDFSLPLDAIEAQLNERTRAIIVNSPNNPAGYVLTGDELRSLHNLACRVDAYIIADEVYEKLVFPGHEHVSIGSFEDTVERVVTINGYSKSHSMTGWRLGYACYPSALGSRMLKIQQHMNTNTCTFIQNAMVRAGDIDMRYLDTYCKTLVQRSAQVAEAIELMPWLKLCQPHAGFFAFVDISGTGMSSNDFCGALMESTGVATTPGIAFGKQWDDHIRLSFATAEATLASGLSLMQEFVELQAQ